MKKCKDKYNCFKKNMTHKKYIGMKKNNDVFYIKKRERKRKRNLTYLFIEGKNNACNNYIITLIENIIILEIIPLIEVKKRVMTKSISLRNKCL